MDRPWKGIRFGLVVIGEDLAKRRGVDRFPDMNFPNVGKFTLGQAGKFAGLERLLGEYISVVQYAQDIRCRNRHVPPPLKSLFSIHSLRSTGLSP